MRDKLIALLSDAEDLPICQDFAGFADYLIARGVIVLPCKIGDTVYIIDEADGECTEKYVLGVEVTQIFINKHGIALDLQLPLGLMLTTWAVIGKNVFLTREEAERNIK